MQTQSFTSGFCKPNNFRAFRKYFFIPLLLVLNFAFCKAQSKFRSFLKLEMPEKIWVLKHPCIAKKTFLITQNSLEQTEIIKTRLLINNDAAGGQLDAFRHGIWMALLTQNIGYRKAISLGKAHERSNYRSFKKSKKEDGIFADAALSEMDYFNNIIGAGIGRINCKMDTDALCLILIDAIKLGDFKIVKKDKSGNCINSQNEPVNCNNTNRVWASDKILVASNQVP